MSVDINWETLTGGADGQELAETIRAFIHERFQQVNFPKLIRSVKVHSFNFGSVAPTIVLKDICEPLPDFYDTNEEDDVSSHTGKRDAADVGPIDTETRVKDKERHARGLDFQDHAATPSLNRGALLGGGPNLGYFHPAFSAGLSGTNTPLAAVAGAQFHGGTSTQLPYHHHAHSFDSASPPSTATPPSRPTSRDQSYFDSRRASAVIDGQGASPPSEHPSYEPSPDDLQVVFHVAYSGDVRLSMTAEVVLDYPMPSFVGIPLKLNITGLRFDGVGILAYIKKKAHVCFLSPEDAEALVGRDGAAVAHNDQDLPAQGSTHGGVGGLLEEIKIESEMGQTEEGKQVLKNVGKIEKFVLEQVQRIFEEEFVYPSFWTFLV